MQVTADRIVAAVQQPIEVSRRQVTVTASVGIALNRIGDTADDILREADLAMYVAKSGGKGRHVLGRPPPESDMGLRDGSGLLHTLRRD